MTLLGVTRLAHGVFRESDHEFDETCAHVTLFFFLELRRRAARHFIKVEKTVHESSRTQTRVQRTNTHITPHELI